MSDRAARLIATALAEGRALDASQLRQVSQIAHQTRQERMAIDGEPELHCHLWAHHLVKNLRAAGFPAQHVAGYVHPVPNGGMPEDGEIHHWAEVGDHVVDIAADQFNYAGSDFPEVLVKHQSKVKTHVPDAVVTPSSFRMVPAEPGASDPRDSVEYDSYEHPQWRHRQWKPVV